MIKPTEIKEKAQKLEEQNYKFRTFLKNRADDDELDAQFLKLHNELFSDYDCCKCTNCCKAYRISLADDEVERIAVFLKMVTSAFIAKYLNKADASDEKPYRFKEKPCSFLGDDGRCQINDCKPDVCVGFPYTNQPDRLSSMFGVIEHAEVCPVVYEILERLKAMYRFRNMS